MLEKIKVKINKKEYEYDYRVKYMDIARDLASEYENDILLVKSDGKLRELFKRAKNNCELEFLDITSKEGYSVYKRSCLFLMIRAVHEICSNKIKNLNVLFSIDNGYYCEIDGDVIIDDDLIERINNKMQELVGKALPIFKENMETDEAIKVFSSYGLKDKKKVLQYRTSSRVNVYTLDGFKDYFYGYMVHNTSVLKHFKVIKYQEGFILKTANSESPKSVPVFNPEDKLYITQRQSHIWSSSQKLETIADLNERVSNGLTDELVLVQEAFQEKCIGDIACEIANRKDVKFVLVAGPSSSGKTTFSHRLSIQLKTLGLNPHPIACDNYFVERHQTPRDETGEYDFEHFDGVDRKLLNDNLTDLLNGKEVLLPTFNFEKGEKEFLGNKLKLGEKDILIIEGIHCLNDELTYRQNKKRKYKIYISALTQINIDEHNRIPTTDDRLIRRIIRDYRTRNTSAIDTIKRWPSVKRGEERNIFPFQDNADIMFNSALIYELAVMKQYVEPLLYSIPKDSVEYIEAKRLMKFFNYFIGFESKHIPNNSILREFIGGSCFNVG